MPPLRERGAESTPARHRARDDETPRSNEPGSVRSSSVSKAPEHKQRRPDLPVEPATKFVTVVNAKTAKVIGVEIPTSLLLRADKVLE